VKHSVLCSCKPAGAIGVFPSCFVSAITLKRQKMTVNNQNPIDQSYQGKEILGVLDACKYMDVSKSYLYKLTHGRVLPFFCPAGKKIYFKKDDLNNWMLQNRRPSKAEIRAEASRYVEKRPINIR
jgi:excisionase family DNA binding protein